MYKSLVENYIRNLSFEEFDNYVRKNYKSVTPDEKKVIYTYIKTRWEDIYNEDKDVLKEVKEKVSESTYQEILKLLDMAYKFKNR